MAEKIQLTGAQRAAIFLLGVGEEAATLVMRHMNPKKFKRLAKQWRLSLSLQTTKLKRF